MRSLIAATAWLWLAIAGLGFAVHGCVRSSEPTTLQILGAAIDPAYAVAMDGCIAEQAALLGQAEAHALTVPEARALIDVVRERCHHAREVFEGLRMIHRAAINALEQGDTEDADRFTQELEQAWEGLREP